MTTRPRKRRVMLAKAGLDGHNRGVHVVARALLESGFEVVYLGVRRTCEEIVAAATQEDVDALGLSILSGAHLELTERLRSGLDESGCSDIPILVGGIIPLADHAALRNLGVVAILGPGTPLDGIVEAFRSATDRRREVERAR